jgi:hypothetical protein
MEGYGYICFPLISSSFLIIVNRSRVEQTTLHARFRFPPRTPAATSSSTAPPPPSDGRPPLDKLPPNVLYNPAKDVVVFAAPSSSEGDLGEGLEKLLRCVFVSFSPSLLLYLHLHHSKRRNADEGV